MNNAKLPDGQRRMTPNLATLHARQIADALTNNDTETHLTAGEVQFLTEPLRAEIMLGTSHRHSTIRFVRLKADQEPSPEVAAAETGAPQTAAGVSSLRR